MYPHRIRLRGPWELALPGAPSRRIRLPDEWTARPGFPGPSRFELRRQFGVPRLIDPDESIWLVWRGTRPLQVMLGDTVLLEHFEADPGVEYDLTTKLQRRNEIVATLDRWDACPVVSLEIRGPYFLRGLRWLPEINNWQGVVVGPEGGDVELHLLAFGRCVARVAAAASPDGRPVVVVPPTSLPEGVYYRSADPWRIELVEGANQWFTQTVEGEESIRFD